MISDKDSGDGVARVDNRIPILDALRAFAALLVVLYHIWQISWIDYTDLLHSPVSLMFLPGMGFLGVDLFFFVSAFCLTLPYVRHWLADGAAPTLKHYVGRRGAKILPSYWLALFLLLVFLRDPHMPKERLWFHLWTHLLFVHNLTFETTGSIAGVLWSLAVEVQFYVLFPLLIPLFRRSPPLLTLAMVCVALFWRAYAIGQLLRDRDEVMFFWRDAQLPARLDMFAAGMIAAYVFVWAQKRTATVRFRPLFAVLALIAIGAVILQMQWWYEITRSRMPFGIAVMVGRLPLAITFLAMSVCGALSPRRFQALLANRAMAFLSAISYNLYLWHQVIALELKKHHIPDWVTEDPHEDPLWVFLYTLIAWTASVLVAAVVTWLWEKPFLRGTFRSIRSRDPRNDQPEASERSGTKTR